MAIRCPGPAPRLVSPPATFSALRRSSSRVTLWSPQLRTTSRPGLSSSSGSVPERNLVRSAAMFSVTRPTMPQPKRAFAGSRAARIRCLGDRLVQLRTHRAQVDLERDAGRPELDGQVLVVAERLVLRLPAAAQGRAGQRLDGPVFASDLDLPCDEEGTVTNRRHSRRAAGGLLRATIQALVQQGAAWAQLDHPGHLVGVTRIGQRPGATIQLEDVALAPQAFADVDAD